jgi:hypothetical protein
LWIKNELFWQQKNIPKRGCFFPDFPFSVIVLYHRFFKKSSRFFTNLMSQNAPIVEKAVDNSWGFPQGNAKGAPPGAEEATRESGHGRQMTQPHRRQGICWAPQQEDGLPRFLGVVCCRLIKKS